jgi:hypothetical protein
MYMPLSISSLQVEGKRGGRILVHGDVLKKGVLGEKVWQEGDGDILCSLPLYLKYRASIFMASGPCPES